MKKKLIALLSVLTCVLCMSACGSETTSYTALEQNKISNCETIANYSLQLVSSIDSDMVSDITSSYNKEEMAALYEESIYNAFGTSVEAELGAFDGLLTTYNQMESDMGGIISTGNVTSTINDDEIIVTIEVFGNECDGSIEFTFSNDIFTRLEEGDAEAATTFSQKMSKAGSHMGTAGLNTLLGMGTVFIMLILISFIIDCFKFIGSGKKEKKAEVKTEAPVVASEPEEDLTDDTELVAVITAAISAYEGSNVSTDGFVVRSIKKANRRI